MLVLPANAGQIAAEATPTGNDAMPEFSYTSTLGCSQEQGEYTVLRTGFGDPIDGDTAGLTVDVAPIGGGDGVTVTFSTPTLEGGDDYAFRRTCPEQDPELHRFAYSRVVLEKQTEGDVPAEATFTVQVDCSGEGSILEDVTRTFEADGGTDQVVFYEFAADCTVTETETGGAESVTIVPSTDDTPEDGELSFSDYGDRTATVTNTFAAAEPEPEPEPTPEPSPTPTDEVADTVEEAEPAEPVVVEPDFTG